MTTQHFFVKLTPPRSTFAQDMTPDEVALMKAHAAYTQEQLEAGKVVLYGPVFDARGIFGVGVFAAADEAEVRAIMDRDPTIVNGLNTYEVHPMRLGGVRAP
jgi:uncharacterized protein